MTAIRAQLFGVAPGLGALIANDLGAVSPGQSVVWPLSAEASASQPYCVGLSTTTNDGIGYALPTSSTPPRLRVKYSK